MSPYRRAAIEVVTAGGPLLPRADFRTQMKLRGFSTSNAYFAEIRREVFPHYKEAKRAAKQDRYINNRSGPVR